MRKILALLVAAIAAYYGHDRLDLGGSPGPAPSGPAGPSGGAAAPTADAIERAFAERRSDVQVEGDGVVVKVLPDDDDGSRHQKFILRLPSGQTVLVAHNIDLAPRVPSLAEGDRIGFFGEYEWNDRGGVVHWTHHDPAGRHVGGWLRRGNKKYE